MQRLIQVCLAGPHDGGASETFYQPAVQGEVGLADVFTVTSWRQAPPWYGALPTNDTHAGCTNGFRIWRAERGSRTFLEAQGDRLSQISVYLSLEGNLIFADVSIAPLFKLIS